MSIFEWDEEEYLKSEREVWREEGMAQGIIRSIIALLEELGEIPDSLRSRLESETDAELLSRFLKMSAKASDIDEFINMTQPYSN